MSINYHESTVTIKNDNYIVRDHRVHNVRILPGVTLLDIIFRLARKYVTKERCFLENILFQAPLATTNFFDQKVQFRFDAKKESGWNVTVKSQKIKENRIVDREWQTVSHCTLKTMKFPVHVKTLDIHSFRQQASQEWDMEEVYGLARSMDIVHGEFMKPKGTVYQKNDEELMELYLSETAERFRGKFIAHPAFLDSATFSGSSFRLNDMEQGRFHSTIPYIPLTIKRFVVNEPFPKTIYVYSKETRSFREDSLPDLTERDIEIYNARGKQIAEFQAITGKRIREPDLIKRFTEVNSQKRFQRGVGPSANNGGKDSETSERTDSLRDVIELYLREQIAERVDTHSHDIDVNIGFYDLGLDSKDLIAITRELERFCDHDFYPTLLFEYKTVDEIRDYLYQNEKESFKRLLDPRKHEPVGKAYETTAEDSSDVKCSPVSPVTNRSSRQRFFINEKIAIIGLAGKYPESENLSEFWNNVKTGRNCIKEIPDDHWSIDRYYANHGEFERTQPHSVSKWGGLIKDMDKFDPLFFKISPQEAEALDPQLRLLLQTAWHTLEDSGYSRQRLRDFIVGVYIGVMNDDYTWLAAEHLAKTGHFESAGSYAHELANRLSYFLDFNGPSLTVETACSSSLTAIHLARRAIQNGECDLALTGGVNISAHRSKYLMLSQLGILSPEGKERTFDKKAKGYVPGEGVGLVLLKPFSLARQDSDYIYGVIRGSAINHSGQGSGKYVPNLQALTDVAQTAIDEADIPVHQIDYIETHGTGTILGDPLEIRALSKLFDQAVSVDKTHEVVLSSKANLGHLEPASGVCSLTKVLLAIQEKTLPPCPNVDDPNPNLCLKQTPFALLPTSRAWEKPPEQRIAAVHTIGVGGSNGFMLIQGVDNTKKPSKRTNDAVAIILSAHTEETLKFSVRNLITYIDSTTPTQLEEIAYTLQVGREAMKYRLATVVNDAETLKRNLKDFLEQKKRDQLLFGKAKKLTTLGKMSKGEDEAKLLQDLIAHRDWERLAAMWVEGYAINWQTCYQTHYTRVALPIYPFAKIRCWINTTNGDLRTRVRQKELLSPPENYDAAFKSQELGTTPAKKPGVLYAIPQWRRQPLTPDLQLNQTGVDQLIVIVDEERQWQETWGGGALHVNVSYLSAPDHETVSQIEMRFIDLFEKVKQCLANYPKKIQQLLILVSDRQPRWHYAPLLGLLKTGMLEHSRFKGKMIYLPAATSSASLSTIVEVESHPASFEDVEIRYDTEGRWVRGLVERKRDDSSTLLSHQDSSVMTNDSVLSEPRNPKVREKGVYWITGGFGGLGRIFANHIINLAASAKVVLSGRSILGPDKAYLLKTLRRKGVEVEYLPVDICETAAVAHAFDTIKKRHGRLTGIIHSAGVIQDALIPEKTSKQIRQVLAPKIRGTLNLDQVSREEHLDFMILFSSLAGITGSVGQCDYAGANAFLDAFAEHRQDLVRMGKRFGKTVAINWPLWEEGGMTVDKETEHWMHAAWGLRPLNTRGGLDAFDVALHNGCSQLVVLCGDHEKVGKILNRRPPENSAKNVESIATVDRRGLEMTLCSRLAEIMSEVLKVNVEDIDVEENWSEYGFDSISLTAFSNRLNREFLMETTPDIFFGYPSLKSLAAFLRQRFNPQVDSQDRTKPAPNSNEDAKSEEIPNPAEQQVFLPTLDTSTRNKAIAIIGMSGIFPKAPNLDVFWMNLHDEKDCISEIPEDRWDWRRYSAMIPPSKRKMTKWGGFVEGIAEFDAAFFGVSPREAELMDPQQRLFLQTVWKAIEDGGYQISGFSEAKVGVFVGVSSNEYGEIVKNAAETESYSSTGLAHSILANRVSYFLDLKGPSEAIDTACSSSLVAIHRAVKSIHSGECEMAIAGGVNALLSPLGFISFNKAGMLSDDGRCKTFDQKANGYTRGEGVGAIVLKPLRQAQSDNDVIYGIIRGSAVNHGGHTNTLTSPNPNAQAELLVQAYEQAGVGKETIGYIETHGTGTALGDPIEVNGLKQAFSKLEDTNKQRPSRLAYCGLGSVKTNIGHLEAAAGIAGVIKVLLSMRYGTLPASIHFKRLNPYIDLTASPFYVVSKTQVWERFKDDQGNSIPRRAGVSSFGFGGSNAHLVLEEYSTETAGDETESTETGKNSSYLIALSAKTDLSLMERIEDLLVWLRREGEKHPLEDICYTLNAGRSHFCHRCATVVGSLDELIKTLEQVHKNQRPRNFLSGKVEKNKPEDEAIYKQVLDRLIEELRTADMQHVANYREKLLAIAALYTKGYEFNWNDVSNSGTRRRISLPTYPFSKERHWISSGDAFTPSQERNATSQKTPISSHEELEGSFFYMPIWEETPLQDQSSITVQESGPVLIIYSERTPLYLALSEAHARNSIFQIKLGDHNDKLNDQAYETDALDPNGIANCCSAIPTPQLIYFTGAIGLKRTRDEMADLEIVQEHGVFSLFRLIRAFASLGWLEKTIRLKIITSQAFRVRPYENSDPLCGAMSGLAGSLSKEYPQLEITYLDLEDFSNDKPYSLAPAFFQEPAQKRNEKVAFRNGKRYELKFAPTTLPLSKTSSFRSEGVYFILGGTGGIGAYLSRYLAINFQARLILVGRRSLNSEIQDMIRQIEAEGGKAHYIQANGETKSELDQALRKAIEIFGVVHGVFHSAITTSDGRIIDLDEKEFRQPVLMSARSSLTLYQVFSKTPLDFIVFFSSISSLGNVGVGNYAAASSLKDAIGLSRENAPFPVSVINWGYWGRIGLGDSEHLKTYFSTLGVQAFGPQEGMEALERILNTGVRQISYLKAEKKWSRTGRAIPEIEVLPITIPPILRLLAVERSNQESGPAIEHNICSSRYKEGYRELQLFIEDVLLSTFKTEGLYHDWTEKYRTDSLKERLRICPQYYQLFDAMLGILIRAGSIQQENDFVYLCKKDLEVPTIAPSVIKERKERLSRKYPELSAYFQLSYSCLNSSFGMLRGIKDPMPILFPRGTLALVDGIYSRHPLTKYFNTILGKYMKAYLDKRLRSDDGTVVHILELGAGTGGTTQYVLPHIKEFRKNITYSYTDISQKFLQHGLEAFGAEFPFVRFQLLDIEKDIEEQGFTRGSIDILLAGNVLHATANMANTLRHAKKLLKSNGLLLIYEATQRNDFATVTFGFTEGWWKFEDPNVRIEGTPLLSPTSWKKLLVQLGYRSVRTVGLPTEPEGEMTQCLILAESDGVLVRETKKINGGKTEKQKSYLEDQSVASCFETTSVDQSGDLIKSNVEAYIKKILSAVLKLNKVDVHQPFNEYGLDSLISQTVLEHLERDFGQLPPILLFEHSTVDKLGNYLINEHSRRVQEILSNRPPGLYKEFSVPPELAVEPFLSKQTPEDGDDADKTRIHSSTARTMRSDNPAGKTRTHPGKEPFPSTSSYKNEGYNIAIVGLTGQYPSAPTLEEFWNNLKLAKDCITEVPDLRWDIQHFYASDPDRVTEGKMYCKWGAFLEGVDQFDPLFFRISPLEAKTMDPQERLMIETAWSVLEDAGYTPEQLNVSPVDETRPNVGVYIGVTSNTYQWLGFEGNSSRTGLTGSLPWSLANRISYLFNFKGPSMPVDTACSSSLTAIHLACEAIKDGQCKHALVGGVNLYLHPSKYVNLCQTRMLSPTGQCRSFGKDGDGFIPGEGVGAVFLKPLDEALADGDHIYGVIKGSAVNHGGTTIGFTAPSPDAQSALIEHALSMAGVDPETITCIEAHGTGTILGDPIEIEGLKRVFGSPQKDGSAFNQRCSIGSVKSNIGHLESAAGIAGLTKVLLQMKYTTLVPSLHSASLNSSFSLSETPLSVQQKTKRWERIQVDGKSIPRRAGISSFGAGGANAHIVVEEAPRRTSRLSLEKSCYLVTLSAKTESALKRQIEELLLWCDKEGQHYSLEEISFTLNMGRSHFEHRCALVVRTVVELRETLHGVMRGKQPKNYVFGKTVEIAVGDEAVYRQVLERVMCELGRIDSHRSRRYRDKLLALAGLYCKGYLLDWKMLHRGKTSHRISLPTYPFAKERYWLDGLEKKHPEVRRNPVGDSRFEEPASSPKGRRDHMVAADGKVQLKSLQTISSEFVTSRISSAPPVTVPALRNVVKEDNKPPAKQRNGGSPLERMTGEAVKSVHNLALKRNVLRELKKAIAQALFLKEEIIEDNKSFSEYGVDSVLGVELIRQINEKFNLKLPATRLYDYPTLNVLTEFIFAETCGGTSEPSLAYDASSRLPSPPPTEQTRIVEKLEAQKPSGLQIGGEEYSGPADESQTLTGLSPGNERNASATLDKSEAKEHDQEDIAVIGLSARLPGARKIQQFWENLKNGVCSIVEVPRERWDVEKFYDVDPEAPGKTYSKWGGFLEGIDEFDPLFFNIPPSEAEWMDPQQRLFLEVCWETLEYGGYGQKTLNGLDCGVYVGVMNNDYLQIIERSRTEDNTAQRVTGNSNAILASRISYFLNLKGPAVTIDTSCSSSLVAVHLACKTLQQEEAKMVMAGGVTLYLTEGSYLGMSRARMLSADGRCKTFDETADGFVPGEGVAVVLLKRYSDARRDGDEIWGIIKGSGINQDGKTNGMTAPSVASQRALELVVYRNYQIHPESIGYVEAHGTGTRLGDPIEVEALTGAFSTYTDKRQYCAIGSVKTNLGHTSAAAGVAGVIKSLLCLRHKKLVPSIHYEVENSHINFDASPFYVNTKYKNWTTKPGIPRRAAVSSFGFSGTNAHLILEEFIEEIRGQEGKKRPTGEKPGYLVPLSGRTSGALEQRIADLGEWLTYNHDGQWLEDISYTLSVGRSHFDRRCVLMVSSVSELLKSLEEVKNGRKPNNYLITRDMAKHQEHEPVFDEVLVQVLKELSSQDLEASAYQKKLLALGDLFVKGYDVDWEILYRGSRRRRVPLPTYPFQKKRYWVPPSKKEIAELPVGKPMLHRLSPHVSLNSSLNVDNGLVFEKDFCPDDIVLAHHRVRRQPVFPAIGYFEMAATVMKQIQPDQQFTYHDLVFFRPMTVSENRHVELIVENQSAGFTYKITSLQNGEPVIHSTGRLKRDSNDKKLEYVNIEGLKKGLTKLDIDLTHFYPNLEVKTGIALGQFYQGIQEVWSAETKVLLQLETHQLHEHGIQAYSFHPAAWVAGLLSPIWLKPESIELLMPFSIKKIQISKHPLSARFYVYVIEKRSHCLDIAILDEEGTVCTKYYDVVLRPYKDPLDGMLYVPSWVSNGLPRRDSSVTVPFSRKTEVVLICNEENRDLADHYGMSFDLNGNVSKLVLTEKDEKKEADVHWINVNSENEIKACLQKALPFKEIHFLGALHKGQPQALDLPWIKRWERFGLISLLNVIRACHQLGYGEKPLRFFIPTQDAFSLTNGHSLNPCSAATVGFAYSLSHEYPSWEVFMCDVSATMLGADKDYLKQFVPISDELNIRRNVVKHEYQLYTRTLEPLSLPPIIETPFRHKGVYVIVGGAGHLGYHLTRYLISRYQAMVIWLGRRELNDAIREKIKDLTRLGSSPRYIQLDEGSTSSTERAFTRIKEREHVIHGVFNLASVGNVAPISSLGEAEFRSSSFDSKVQSGLSLYSILKNEMLDFLVFFSSMQSFSQSLSFMPVNQSSYVAGCMFQDALALEMNKKLNFPVKTINWGYWFTIKNPEAKAHEIVMKENGLYALGLEEGMEALERILRCDLDQIVVTKASKKIMNQMNIVWDHQSNVLARQQGSVMRSIMNQIPDRSREIKYILSQESVALEGLEELARDGLIRILLHMGLFETISVPHGLESVRVSLGVIDKYKRLLKTAIATLIEAGYVDQQNNRFILKQGVQAIRKWANGMDWDKKAEQIVDRSPGLRAHVQLLRSCLRSLPDVLKGGLQATEVLFPSSSTNLVNEIYEDSPLARYFNERLADAVEAYVNHRMLDLSGSEKIRILELGAGTGGSSRFILSRLKPHADHLQYFYTDISESFLLLAEERFLKEYPFVQVQAFDVERPPGIQGIEENYVDVVVASNVLHATHNISQSLSQVRAAMKAAGWLVLNEISTVRLSATLTFGLLDGWWYFRDEELRLPGCPGLSPQSWKRVLCESGFEHVVFLDREAQELGQQVIVAEGNGVASQSAISHKEVVNKENFEAQVKPIKISKRVKTEGEELLNKPQSYSLSVANEGALIDDFNLKSYIRQTLSRNLSQSLKIHEEEIDVEFPFADYGVDSILSVGFVQRVNEKLNINLSTSDLFNHTNVVQLTEFIFDRYRYKIIQNEQIGNTHVQQPVLLEEDQLFEEASVEINRDVDASLDQLSQNFMDGDLTVDQIIDLTGKLALKE